MVWEGFKLFMAYLLHYKTSKWSKTSISCGRIVINIPLNSGRICLNSRVKLATLHETVSPGADPGFDQGGGPQFVTGLKLPFWGLSFGAGASFLVVRGGGRAPGAPPWIRP